MSSRVSYYLMPNKSFAAMTGCYPTGRVDWSTLVPKTEWSCPNRFPELPIDPSTGQYAWWSGRGIGEGPEQWYIVPLEQNTIVQEQLATPEGQALLRRTADVRTYQQAAISQLTSVQQAMVRELLAQGTYRTVEEALDHVRQEAGLGPLDYSDASIQSFIVDVQAWQGQQQTAQSGNRLAWYVLGGTLLLFGGAAAYTWWKRG